MKCTKRATSTLSNGNACASRSEETNFNDTDLSLAEEGGVTVSGSSGKKSGSSTYRRLGEAVKQVSIVRYMTLMTHDRVKTFLCETNPAYVFC